MGDEDLRGSEYMWTTNKEDYCLMREDAPSENYLICHVPTRSFVLIEDDKEYAAILRKLVDAGVRIINHPSEI